LKKGGERFEIACYKNKVISWRNKVDKDLDDVLQSYSVFTNVSKGQMAKRESLMEAFGTEDEKKSCIEILDKGELQVSEKERHQQIENLSKELATCVAEMCVNPETKRPYTVTMIENAMHESHFSLNHTKSAKSQALDVIKLLQNTGTIPIQRAEMKVRVEIPIKEAKKLKDKVHKLVKHLDSEDYNTDTLEIVGDIDPGSFREIDELLSAETKGKGRIEVTSFKVVHEGGGC